MNEADSNSSLRRANAIAEALQGKKALDVVILDVREHSQFTDFFVVASAGSTPHIKALAAEADAALTAHNVKNARQSGQPDSGWVIVDGLDTVTHIFSKEARSYYAIEDLWKPANRPPTP